MRKTADWNAPGGGTAYLDAATGDSLLIFHAQNLPEGGVPHVWLKAITWANDWPALTDLSSARN